MESTCDLCGSTDDVRYCGICDANLCAACRANPVKRALAAGRKALRTVASRLVVER